MSFRLDDLSALPERYRQQAQKQMQEQSIDRTARILAREAEQRRAEAESATRRKHGNHPTARTLPNGDEHVFDSRKEAGRYDELALLLKAGAIRELRLQPQFTLKESYITANGDRSRAVRYAADFSYEERGVDGQWRTVVEDVKGPSTKKEKTYRMKVKLMQDIHHITVREV